MRESSSVRLTLNAEYWKNRFKDFLRELMPARLRFVRLGKLFLKNGGAEADILGSLVKYGSTVIDIGANVGQFTYALCNHVGPKGRVLAIEPLPELAQLLRTATTSLNLPVTVFECALSCRDGYSDLNIPVLNGEKRHALASLERHNSTGLHRRVRLRRLDDLCRNVRDWISFIKIDVEGHELELLRGATHTLAKHRPTLLIEIEQRHSPVPIDTTFRFLESLGYKGEFLNSDGRCTPIALFDVNKHQTRHLSDIGTPAYINNFVFRTSAPAVRPPETEVPSIVA